MSRVLDTEHAGEAPVLRVASPLTSSEIDEVLSDEHLVGRTLDGAREAFNQLVVRHEARLFRFLSRTSPNAADVEDAMQRAFVKAYQKLGTFDPRYRFTTWLFTIAVRELRSMRRRPSAAVGSLEDAHEAVAPAAVDREPGDLWAAARRLLTSGQYTALWLRYGEDLEVREVARVMGRPRVWVSVTLHRACAALRGVVGRDGVDGRRLSVANGPGGSKNSGKRAARGVS
jgi:RNA polymerase sigma-70 factor (ECF subfamily)